MLILKEQDKDDDDGLEKYVRQCMESNKADWFPRNRAVILEEHSQHGDEN